MFDGTRKRVAMALDKENVAPGIRVFALLEVLCFYVSAIVFLFLAGLIAASRLGGYELTGAWHAAFQVFLTAAVGYLTNWLAIEMIFKPYEPIRWLWFWRQGLISRNKAEIGRKAGEKIKSELLDPCEIADRLSAVVSKMLESEEMREDLSEQILQFIRETLKDSLNAQVGRLQPNVKPDFSSLGVLAESCMKPVIDSLKKRIAETIDRRFDSELLKHWLKDSFVPFVKPKLEEVIRKNTPAVVDNIDFGKMISDEIEKQDVREFHSMINDVAAEHLGAIQVLGFFLGGLAGLLQLLL